MNYLIVKDNVITNIIVCDNDEIASEFGALPSYKSAAIGDVYSPTIEKPTAAQLRENEYNTKKVVEWDSAVITVTEASQKWQYYAAEGNTEKASKLTELIAEAKANIREQYPDEEVSE